MKKNVFVFTLLIGSVALGAKPTLFNGVVSRTVVDALISADQFPVSGVSVQVTGSGDTTTWTASSPAAADVVTCTAKGKKDDPYLRFRVNHAKCEFSEALRPKADRQQHQAAAEVLLAILKNSVKHSSVSSSAGSISTRSSRVFEEVTVEFGSSLTISAMTHHKIECRTSNGKAQCELHFESIGDKALAQTIFTAISSDPAVSESIRSTRDLGMSLSSAPRIIENLYLSEKYPGTHRLQFSFHNKSAKEGELGAVDFELEVFEEKGQYRVRTVKQQLGYLRQVKLR